MTVFQRGTTDEDGAVLVEFAIVFVLFATLLWGLITYGVIFAAQQSLTHAAGEAARATVGYADETEARTVATNVASDQLDWLGASAAPADTDVTFGDCAQPSDRNPFVDGPVDTGAAEQCVFVSYEYPWGADPIVPTLLSIATPTTLRGTAAITWDGS